MRLILRGHELVPDTWERVAEPLSAVDADALISLADLRSAPEAWFERSGRLGVALEPPDDVLQLASHIERLSVVTINFPGVGEGRGYTQARQLRARLGYDGEVRAVGEVRRDLVFLMARAGIDAFAPPAGEPAEALRDEFVRFSVAYQRAPGLLAQPLQRGGLQRIGS